MAPSVVLGEGQAPSLEVEDGSNLTLSVSITGFNVSLTDISWTQLGSALTSGQGGRVTITNTPLMIAPVNSTLTITSVLPNESGSYVVTATNAAGSDNFMFSVSVTCKEIVNTEAITIFCYQLPYSSSCGIN